MSLHDDENDPFGDSGGVLSGSPMSGIILVAVTNFLVGAILIVAAVAAMTKLAPLTSIMSGQFTTVVSPLVDSQQGEQVEWILRTAERFMGILLVLSLVIGGLCTAAGFGVLYLSPWGRGLTIVLGFLSAAISAACFLIVNLPGMVVYGAYAMVSLIVLFDKDYARQFR